MAQQPPQYGESAQASYGPAGSQSPEPRQPQFGSRSGQQQAAQPPLRTQQPPQQTQQSPRQPSAGQQPAGSAHQQSMGIRFEAGITDEMQTALFDITEAIKVCEWCADQCLDEGPGMATCIRLCRDVTDAGALTLQLGSRDSMFSPDAAELFLSAAEACRDECARHSHAHCQDCAQVLSRAVQSTRQMLSSVGGSQPSIGGTSGGMSGGMQFASGSTGQF